MSAPTVEGLQAELDRVQAQLELQSAELARMTLRAHSSEHSLAQAATTNRRLRRLVQLLIDYAGGSAHPTHVDGPGDVW